MADYLRNHTLPRCLLNYWQDPTGPYPGVHVHEIPTAKTSFSSAKGKNGYSFAIVEDLHIPTVNGQRLTSLEQWLALHESALAAFAKKSHARQPVHALTARERTALLMGLKGLEHRSRYHQTLVRQVLEQDPALAEAASRGEGDARQKTLEALIHLITEESIPLHQADITLWAAPENRPWITCDRPVIRLETPPHDLTTSAAIKQPRFPPTLTVLTSRILVYCEPAEEAGLSLTSQDAAPGQVEEINRRLALQARDWIVAATAADLARYIPLTTSAEWHASVAQDHVSPRPIRYLQRGWRITR